MKKDTDNIIVIKSKNFAIRIIKLYQYLTDKKKEFILSKQILRSETSIGANVKEATRAQSKADFASKIGISLKEASETEYWLELLVATNYLSTEQFTSLQKIMLNSLKFLLLFHIQLHLGQINYALRI